MRRLLLGFVFSAALLMAGTASALVMTSGEVPVIDREHRNNQIFQNVGELVATDIQLVPLRRTSSFGRRSYRWQGSVPFEWPRSEWSGRRDSFKDKFPLFAHFPFGSLGEYHDYCRGDDDGPPGDPVPEPTTALLFGAGLLGLGLMRRRQR